METLTTAPESKVNDVMAAITARVIEAIKAGTAPWQKPWIAREDTTGAQNLATGKLYRGLNALYLGMMSSAMGAPYWIGFGQARDKGGTVRKGEKSTAILAPVIVNYVDKTTNEKRSFTKGFRIVHVFHVSQCDGLTLPAKIESAPRVLEANRLDKFVSATGANVVHMGDSACYIPSIDAIRMPEKNAFANEGGYYGTMLHELTHWTGHKSRLDRLDGTNHKGYAYEELIAELGAYYASEKLGCPNECENHASYLGHWLKALESDPKYLWSAASAAERAANYLLATADANMGALTIAA
jgi:antirestriction protein ArdC